MTQPPDDAALVARLRQGRLIRESTPIEIGEHGTAWSGEVRELPHPDALEAATALEAKDRRIAELVDLCDAACSNADTALNFLASAGRPGLADTQRVYVANIRAALEPSDKGVGR